jgi:hypothetical protein
MKQVYGFQAEENSFIRGNFRDATTLNSLKNWYPVCFDNDDRSQLFWRYMGLQQFTASFFQNSLAMQIPEQRQVCRTSVSSLAQFDDCVLPTAFIFHVSRCGSTLLTQMLASLNSTIVLSEPPILDAFFRSYPDYKEENLQLFRHLIHCLGQKRFDLEQHFVIKFDSWHVSRIDFIRQAFPQVPMLFLYRHPQAVLVSHQKQRGPQMIPDFVDMGNLVVDRAEVSPGDLDGFCLRVLDQFYQTALLHAKNGRLHLINYSELPSLVWDTLLNKLNIHCTPEEIDQIKARSQFHSKHPQQIFNEDVKPVQKHLFFEKTLGFYLQLDNLRKS